MNIILTGPFPFDCANVLQSGRVALSEVGTALREGRIAEQPVAQGTREEGVYIVLANRAGDSPAILGFWVVFGQSYLDSGTPGPPDRFPPYAGKLLEAATEEVWWRNFPVVPRSSGRWRPLILLEWPPPLAVRSASPPPGILNATREDQSAHDAEQGRLIDLRALGGLPTDEPLITQVEDELVDPYADLPADRGLITVVRGELRYTQALHTGRFALIPPSLLGEGSPVPLETWLPRAQEIPLPEEVEDVDTSGPPLALPGGQVAFALGGWLTRGLDRWPERSAEITVGELPTRVVRTRWKGQVARAVISMVAVLLGVGSLAVGVRLAAEPNPQPLAVTPSPAPQPAMSVCSADHQKFVAELRCQIQRLSGTEETFPTAPACGDQGSTEPASLTNTADLQASWCGLLDRSLDGWTGNLAEDETTWNFGHLAAAQACFNVLGHPYPYAQSAERSATVMIADPDRFLRDNSLGIASLVELVSELQDACDTSRARLEARLEGAIFATHIGAPYTAQPNTTRGKESEPAALRRALTGIAEQGMNRATTRCFESGIRDGIVAEGYRGLCGADDEVDARLSGVKIWQRLAGAEVEGALSRYVAARFGDTRPPHPW